MSSYALLGALSGFRYSAATKTLWFGPKLKARPFRSFFSAASAFGTIELTTNTVKVHVIEGELEIEKLLLHDLENEKAFEWKTTITQNALATRSIAG